MLTRMVGGGLVLLGGAWMGWRAAEELRRHVRLLRAFGSALEAAERELSYSAAAMPELLALLSRRFDGETGGFFRRCRDGLAQLDLVGFGELWRRELSSGLPAPLNQDELALLGHLGDILGRYDGEGQQAAIRTAREDLRALCGRAEETRDRLGRVYQAVGVTAGSALAILLI